MSSTVNNGANLKAANETCRMAWFVVNVQENIYSIIHAVDVVDNDLGHMYLNRNVRFNRKNEIVMGKLVAATDCRTAAENFMNQLIGDNTDKIVNEEYCKEDEENGPNSYYLIQYEKDPTNLIQTLVHENEIENAVNLPDKCEFTLDDGGVKRTAKLLHARKSKDYLESQLNRLKVICFNGQAFAEKTYEIDMDLNPWLLVQYSCSTTDVIYAIVRFEDTIWQNYNVYSSEVVYFSDGNITYQGIIIMKSLEYQVLDLELSKMKIFSSQIDFPIEDDVSYDSNSEELLDKILEKENHKGIGTYEMNSNLNEYLETTRTDIENIVNSFSNIRSLKGNMETRYEKLQIIDISEKYKKN